jgi:hypothetical protein
MARQHRFAVDGYCPMGCGRRLIFDDRTSRVECVSVVCPRPMAADEVLHLSADHFVVFDEDRFTVEHPLRERVQGTMTSCAVLDVLREISAPPPGRYRVVPGVWSLRRGRLPFDLERVEVH